jgi:hypothetical protein
VKKSAAACVQCCRGFRTSASLPVLPHNGHKADLLPWPKSGKAASCAVMAAAPRHPLRAGYAPSSQVKNSTAAVFKSYIAPTILMVPLLSSSAKTVLFFRMSLTVMSTFLRATASMNA